MKKYVHDEVVRAWLDGKDVQMQTSSGWETIKRDASDTLVPPFFSHYTYRVKPNTIKYRRALYKDEGGGFKVLCTNDLDDEQGIYFVRWIDNDWQEVEVEA